MAFKLGFINVKAYYNTTTPFPLGMQKICIPFDATVLRDTPVEWIYGFLDFCNRSAELAAQLDCGFFSPRETFIWNGSNHQQYLDTSADGMVSCFDPYYLGGLILVIDDHRTITATSNGNVTTFHYLWDGTEIFASSSRALGNYITIPWYSPSFSETILTAYSMSGDMRGDQTYWGLGPVPNSAETLNATKAELELFFLGIEYLDPDDPYQDIPDSSPSGPATGTGIPANDAVDFPDLPTVSAADTGFITLYNPTLAQVKDLADYMWTGLFDLATYKKIFADPMDCILGFNMLPVSIPHGTAKSVTVGNISTGVQMNPATSQWIEVNCGSINMDDAFGCYLSYAPYTKVSLYLPYIGTVELSTDDVIGKTLTLKYHVDCLSCSCVAYLKCGDSVLYQFTGACGYSIPVNGNDFRSTIGSIVSIAASIGGAVASGGITAPAAIAMGASTANNVMNAKPEIHRSGAIGSSAGIMGLQKPYLIVEYPNPCKPKKQYHFTGYPSFVTVKLGDLSGFASFENVILDGISCTDEERQIISAMCQEGIYL